MRKTVVLVILDGWGVGSPDESNPIYVANPKSLIYAAENYPFGALHASGIMVGLPWREPGGSDTGHLTLGAGKIIYHNYPKISLAIKDGSFFENSVLKGVFYGANKKSGAIHLIGLLGEGSSHASLDHLIAILEMVKKESLKDVFIHLITDGIDSPPRSAGKLLEKIEGEIKRIGIGKIASLAGRFYAMDSSGAWDRTRKYYESLTGNAETAETPENAIEKARAKNLDDAFIPPTILGSQMTIKENDSIVFFNFRGDELRQISDVFTENNFSYFPAKNPGNLCVATLAKYSESTFAQIAFPPDRVSLPLSKVLAENQKTQIKITESLKKDHLTYFFNGAIRAPLAGEYRVIIPSQKTVTPEDYPEMRAKEITDRVLASINEGGFDFIAANYPNADAMAHTGSFGATLAAVKFLDGELGKIISAAERQNHTLLITSDHGNAERLLDIKTGEPQTGHEINPVPIYAIGNEFRKIREPFNPYVPPQVIGSLSDVAPTILEILGIPVPEEMTGEGLLNQF